MSQQSRTRRIRIQSRHPGLPRLWLAQVLAGIGLQLAALGTAHGDVVLVLTDGRQVRADRIGPETDATRLAVLRETERITLVRHIPWGKVRDGSVEGRDYDRDELFAAFAAGNRARISADATVTGSADSRRVTAVSSAGPHLLAAGARTRSPTGPAGGIGQPEFPHSLPCPPVHGYARVLDARILGVRDDPLDAYPGLLARHFPDGVPLIETPFVLDVLRAKKAQQMLFPPEHFFPPVERGPRPDPPEPRFVPPAPPQ